MIRQLSRSMLAITAAFVASGASRSPIAAQFAPARTITGASIEVADRVSIVNFWATWCVPCRVELPILDAYYRKHSNEGLTVIAVAMDAGAPTGRLKDATARFAMPVVPVSHVRIPRPDIPNGLPVTRIYDRHGQLRFDSARDGKGIIDAATLERVAGPLLRER